MMTTAACSLVSTELKAICHDTHHHKEGNYGRIIPWFLIPAPLESDEECRGQGHCQEGPKIINLQP